MSKLSAAARDVRALGSSAPLRAAYEASKRSGFHSVLFRKTSSRRQYRSVPIGLGAVTEVDYKAKESCLVDAAKIVDEGVRVFGRRVPTGTHESWAFDPLTTGEWDKDKKWWQIDIRSDDRLSDVKFVWEAARHRDLVVLARAAAIDDDGRWIDHLEMMLEKWVRESPPETGVNWYSSLELALRAIAWSQVLALVGDRLEPRLREELDAQLVASARHIALELPYTVSSMKNNHLLGDGLGLVVLGRMFPEHPRSKFWVSIGDRLFLKQLDRHMRADGSMIEDSLSYHRFVLEMLIVRVLVGGADERCHTAMRGASLHLANLGALEGPVPQFGDWDEGRVLASSSEKISVAGSAALGLALSDALPPTIDVTGIEEVAWYFPGRLPRAEKVNSSQDVVVTSGDFQVVRQGDWKVWFKVAGGSSHQHADISSVFVAFKDRWIVSDPGTGTYNGSLNVRNGFRTSSAHPVWHPVGVDQLEPHRAFRWMRTARGHSAKRALTLGRRTVLFGWHDAFERLELPARVARVVIVSDEYVAMVDFVENIEKRRDQWEMSVPLGGPREASAVFGVNLFGLDRAQELTGQLTPFAGWQSSTYGTWEPSTWLRTSVALRSVKVWGLGIEPDIDEGNPVIIDGLEIEIDWTLTPSVLVRETSTGQEFELRAGPVDA